MERTVTVNSRGFDGEIRKSWTAKLLNTKNGMISLLGVFDADVDHSKLGFIKRGTISYEYYWLERWYNVFRFHEPEGALRNYYCNISMPPTFKNDVLNYVDLDIDVLVWKDFRYAVLDEDEYVSRAAIFDYPEDIRNNARNALAEVIRNIGIRDFPFW